MSLLRTGQKAGSSWGPPSKSTESHMPRGSVALHCVGGQAVRFISKARPPGPEQTVSCCLLSPQQEARIPLPRPCLGWHVPDDNTWRQGG